MFRIPFTLIALVVCTFSFADAQRISETTTKESVLDFACESVRSTVPVNDILSLGLLQLEELITEPTDVTAQAARDVLFRTAVYDVEVIKICGSCESLDAWYFQTRQAFPSIHREFCDTTSDGYQENQSALLFLPKDGVEIVTNTKLRPFLYMRATYFDRLSAPSLAFPSTLRTEIEEVKQQNVALSHRITQFLPSLLAAASGSVAIMPDYTGYGESTINPTILNHRAYKQAAVVSFLSTQRYFDTTFSCTKLDLSGATIQGVEDGAFGAVFVAQTLGRYGLRISKVFLGASIFDLDTFIYETVGGSHEGGQQMMVPARSNELLAQVAFSFSNGLSNSQTEQDMVSDDARDQLEAFLLTPIGNTTTPTEQEARLNLTFPEFLNQDLLEFYRNSRVDGNKSPCSSSEGQGHETIGELCKVISEASAWPILLSDHDLRYKWVHQTELCYSPEDTVVSQHQIDDAELSTWQPMIIRVYEGPVGTSPSDTFLKPVGENHERVLDICRISSALYFGLQGHTPDEESEKPNFMAALDQTDSENCRPREVPVNEEEVPYLIAKMSFNETSISYLSWKPDGSVVAIATHSTVYAWENGKTVAIIDGHENATSSGGTIAGIDWSPDGRLFAIAHRNGSTVRVYSPSDWKLAQEAELGMANISSVVFSPDGQYLVATSEAHNTTNQVIVLSTETWDVVETYQPGVAVFSSRFSPDGIFLALGTLEEIILLDTTSWQAAKNLKYELYTLYEGLAWAPDGSRIAAIARVKPKFEQIVVVIDVSQGMQTPLVREDGEKKFAVSVDWNPTNPEEIAISDESVAGQGSVSILRGDTAGVLVSGEKMNAIAFSTDGETLAISSSSGIATLWNITAFTESFDTENSNVVQEAMCQDGSACWQRCGEPSFLSQDCFSNSTNIANNTTYEACTRCMTLGVDGDLDAGTVPTDELNSLICSRRSSCEEFCGECFRQVLEFSICAWNCDDTAYSDAPTMEPGLLNHTNSSDPPQNHQPTETVPVSTPAPASPENIFSRPSTFSERIVILIWGLTSEMNAREARAFEMGTQAFLYQWDPSVQLQVLSQRVIEARRRLDADRSLQETSLEVTLAVGSKTDEEPSLTASQAIAGLNIPAYLQQLRFQDPDSFSTITNVQVRRDFDEARTPAPTSVIPPLIEPTGDSGDTKLTTAVIATLAAIGCLAFTCLCCACVRLGPVIGARGNKTNSRYSSPDREQAHFAEDDGRDAFHDDGPIRHRPPTKTPVRKKLVRAHSGQSNPNHEYPASDSSLSSIKDESMSSDSSRDESELNHGSLAEIGMSLFGECGSNPN